MVSEGAAAAGKRLLLQPALVGLVADEVVCEAVAVRVAARAAAAWCRAVAARPDDVEVVDRLHA